MRGTAQNALRLFTRAMRPLALRSAGREGTATSVVRHVGRRSGRTYLTPVVVARHDDSFLIALPYGERTDWLKNVLAAGSASIMANGRSYDVDRPEVTPWQRRPPTSGPETSACTGNSTSIPPSRSTSGRKIPWRLSARTRRRALVSWSPAGPPGTDADLADMRPPMPATTTRRHGTKSAFGSYLGATPCEFDHRE